MIVGSGRTCARGQLYNEQILNTTTAGRGLGLKVDGAKQEDELDVHGENERSNVKNTHRLCVVLYQYRYTIVLNTGGTFIAGERINRNEIRCVYKHTIRREIHS